MRKRKGLRAQMRDYNHITREIKAAAAKQAQQSIMACCDLVTPEAHALRDDLACFTGTEQWHKHGLSGMLYTDGVLYLAEKAGAHWLVDLVASYQPRLRRASSFAEGQLQIWRLRVDLAKREAVAECCEDIDGQDNSILVHVRQHIPFTDFPLDEIKLYVANGVLHLPSEY